MVHLVSNLSYSMKKCYEFFTTMLTILYFFRNFVKYFNSIIHRKMSVNLVHFYQPTEKKKLGNLILKFQVSVI